MADKPYPKQSHTGGVKPMMLQTRLTNERERLIGMTDEERAWRKKWLKDQILSPNEPVHVPEYWKKRFNPIRQFYRWPLDQLQKAATPLVGETQAMYWRFGIGKAGLFAAFILAATYYMKYNANDWTRTSGWRLTYSRSQVLPGDPGYPMLSDRSKPSDYSDRGFKHSPI